MGSGDADVVPRKHAPPKVVTLGAVVLATSMAASVGMGLMFDKEKKTYDPENPQTSPVHIRVQQRKAKCYVTTVQGLAEDLDLKLIKKYIKHTCKVSGTLRKDEEYGLILIFSGDIRHKIFDFLTQHHICSADLVKVHGT